MYAFCVCMYVHTYICNIVMPGVGLVGIIDD